MDPWTAESDQFLKKDCRDLRTGEPVQIWSDFLKTYAGTHGRSDRSKFLKGDTGINGPLIWSNFFKRYARTHGRSCQAEF